MKRNKTKRKKITGFEKRNETEKIKNEMKRKKIKGQETKRNEK
jgi:hypothetical protein